MGKSGELWGKSANFASEVSSKRTGMRFLGNIEAKTDAKGRVSLPAKFRKVLSEDLVVTVALTEDHLLVFDGQDSFNAWVDGIFADKFGGYNSTSREQLYWRSALKNNLCCSFSINTSPVFLF